MKFPDRANQTFPAINPGVGLLKFFLSLTLLSISAISYAQVETAKAESKREDFEEHNMKGTHRFTFELAHTHISEGKDADGKRKWLALPSLSLNYDYWIADKWALGVHSDLITETFKVEKHMGDESELERTTPFAIAAVGLFKPGKHSTFIIGTGVEFSKEANLFMNRVGYEWGAEFNDRWEVGATIAYDIRWNAYDSWTIGFGLSYLVNRKSHKPKH